MLILAVETSCDETSVALVRDGRRILSNVVSSQIALHSPYGGVVPEIASRHHVEVITQITRTALDSAQIDLNSVDAVASTRGPGLAGSLLVGFTFAAGLSLGLGVPFAGVNHLHGHLYSVWLQSGDVAAPAPPLPLLVLVVSGGHTELVLMRTHGDYEVLGRTLDDAAGEAFDKVARLLGLPYPGGPAIQRVAAVDTGELAFPRAWLPGTDNFSFSGLKTSVLHAVRRMAHGEDAPHNAVARTTEPALSDALSQGEVALLAGAFQESVVDILSRKTVAAAARHEAAGIAVVGGVAANTALSRRMRAVSTLPVYIAPPALCTDNAAMIGAAAHFVPDVWGPSDVAPSLDL